MRRRRPPPQPHPYGVQHLAPRFLLVTILLVAFALRCYRLDAQSLWNDEGNSARIAERPIPLILEGAAGDIHPPGYYLLLHYWRALFGQSEYALRCLSAFAGLMLVVFTYLLGRRLFGTATALGAAFLTAISPFAVYYSQEARMYALLAALSAASTYLLLRTLVRARRALPDPHSPIPVLRRSSPDPNRPSLSTITAYVLTSAAGLYTHYAFPFVLFVHNIVFALWWLVVAHRSLRRWRWPVVWVGVQAAIVALYLPWLPTALGSVTGWSAAGRGYRLGPGLLDMLRVLSVGITLPAAEAKVSLIGAGSLLLTGLWPAWGFTTGFKRTRWDNWFGTASLVIYLLLPIFLIFAFDLYKPAWLKFLLVVVPPFHLILARGICRLSVPANRIGRATSHLRSAVQELPVTRGVSYAVPIVLFLACLAAIAPSLRNLYFDPAYARDDYRQIATDIAATARPGDGIILDAPNQWEVFTYYYPDRDVHPAPYRPDPDSVETFLAPLTESYRRLFVLYWGNAEADPQHLVEAGLAAQAYKASDRWYGNVRLATYAMAPLPEEPAVIVDARFGETIRLHGYNIAEDALTPGDILPVALFWQIDGPVPERYKITVQLLDGAGQLVAQHDTEPGDGLTPTTTWEPGRVPPDRCGVPLPPGLTPGEYTLIVGLYHIATGERLPVTLAGEAVGDHLPLNTIRIEQ